jgi:hypothetical protein
VGVALDHLVGAVEAAGHGLAPGARLGARAPAPQALEGRPSAMVTAIARAVLAGAERLYLADGRGLASLVHPISPPIDDRARATFAAAASALSALPPVPVEGGALDSSLRALTELQRVLETDVSNALGVTLVFTGKDGD